MDKDWVLNIFREVLLKNKSISEKIFQCGEVPPNFSEVIFQLSSLDFVEFLLVVETAVGVDFADELYVPSACTFDMLAERIVEIVQYNTYF